MINPLDLSRYFKNQWIVLDHEYRVIDHGPELAELREKHSGAHRTFYFVSREG